MLYTIDQLRATLRKDLSPYLKAIAQAQGIEPAMYASGELAGRLLELDRLGVLQHGERQAWLADAAQAISKKRRALDDDPLYKIVTI
jgi:hypothetical protein